MYLLNKWFKHRDTYPLNFFNGGGNVGSFIGGDWNGLPPREISHFYPTSLKKMCEYPSSPVLS